MRYAELGVTTNFSFLRGASHADELVAQAKALGLIYVGCAWIGHKSPFDEKQCRAAAAVFNRAGKGLSEHGMKFYYHNHGYEFYPHGSGTLFDLLVAETDPQTVYFQMDVLWTVFPGQDPAKLLEKYPNRWLLLHLKDLKKLRSSRKSSWAISSSRLRLVADTTRTSIRIGARVNVQDLCMLHVTNRKFSLTLEDGASVGHSVSLHGCVLRSGCLIGIGAIVLDGARVCTGSIIAAGALVPPGKEIPAGSVASGTPAELVGLVKGNGLCDANLTVGHAKVESAWEKLLDGSPLAWDTAWETSGNQKDTRKHWTAGPDGVLTGYAAKGTPGSSHLYYTKKSFKNFEVRAEICISDDGNSGFYFRADEVKDAVGVNGFQAEIAAAKDVGGLYETGGRAWVVQPAPDQVKKWFKPQEWNEMTVSAHGRRIVVHVNGHRTAELADDPGRLEGHLALQLHGGTRNLLAAARRVHVLDPVEVGDDLHAILDDRDQVVVVDILLLVSQLGEEEIGAVELFLRQLDLRRRDVLVELLDRSRAVDDRAHDRVAQAPGEGPGGGCRNLHRLFSLPESLAQPVEREIQTGDYVLCPACYLKDASGNSRLMKIRVAEFIQLVI